MSALENFKDKFKQFKPTTWSIKNKTSIYLIMLFVSMAGIFQFMTLPKEQFPDIVIPTIYVQTIYVGNSPKDMENLVTQPIEKQLKSISGIKIDKITSTSIQDFSAIIIDFDASEKVSARIHQQTEPLTSRARYVPASGIKTGRRETVQISARC